MYNGLVNVETYSIYTTASQDHVVETMSRVLDELLQEHYRTFKRNVLMGLALAILGVILLLFGTLYAALITLIGLAAIVYAFMRKIHIREAGVILYPILAIPYGDLSLSALVDVLAAGGEDVSFKISRVDKIKNVIEEHLKALERLQDFYVNPNVATDVSSIFKISSKGGIEITFEEDSIMRLAELARTFSERPYDEFSFKLFLSSGDIILYPYDESVERFVLGSRVFEKVEKYVEKINALMESLKVEYTDLLTLVLNRLDRFTETIRRYYGEVEGKILVLRDLLRCLEERPKIRLCPRCIDIHRGSVLRSAYLPVLQSGGYDPKEGVFEYVCPECGEVYYESVHSNTILRAPLKRYQLDVLRIKMWNKIYLSEINEINRYISEARRRKQEVFSQAVQRMEDLNEQFKTRTLPIYLELGKVYSEIQANESFTRWAHENRIALPILCYSLSNVSIDFSLVKTVSQIMGGERVAFQHLVEELKKHTGLRTSILFDELFISILEEALSKMNKLEDAERVRNAYKERLYDELEAILSRGGVGKQS